METMDSGRMSNSEKLSNAAANHKNAKTIHVIFCGIKNVINCFYLKIFFSQNMVCSFEWHGLFII